MIPGDLERTGVDSWSIWNLQGSYHLGTGVPAVSSTPASQPGDSGVRTRWRMATAL